MKTISILIPVYNVEKYIERCLSSIASQTYTDGVECVLIDDCGTDNSIALAEDFIEKYSGKIAFKIIKHPCNKGLAAARNTGISNSSGDYIIHIDSDDYCEPDMLESYHNVIERTNPDIIVSDYWYTYEDHEKYAQQFVADTKVGLVKDLFSHRLFTVNWNKCIKRQLYDDYNITYPNGHNYGEDMNVCFPLCLAAKQIQYINKAFVHYVQYNSNAYNNDISKKSLEDYIYNLKSVIKTLQDNNLFESCKEDVYEKQLFLRNMLLWKSKGKLQSRWAKEFPDSVKRINMMAGNRLFILCTKLTYYGVLIPYNLYRWLSIKKNHLKVKIYE